MFRCVLVAAVVVPAAAFAVGSDDDSPPEPTQTTTECADGKVWDDTAKACVEVESRLLDDDDRYRAVREFAYAHRFDDALRALDAMQEGESDRVLTYRGFLARSAGDLDAAMVYYKAALAANPDNLLARSYMGLGLVASGQPDAARVQLAEIRARGGRGSWPEKALEMAIASGHTPGY